MVKVKNYEDYFEKVHDLGLYPWYDEKNELVRVMLSDGSNVLSIKTNRTADLITLRQFGNLGYDVKSELLELSTSLALYPTSERGNIPNYENPRFEEDDWGYDDECDCDDECDSYGYCECHDVYGYYEDCDCQNGFDEDEDDEGNQDDKFINSLYDDLKTVEKNELEEISQDEFFKTNKLKYLLKSTISDLKDKDIHIGIGYQDVDEAELDGLVDFLKLINEELDNILNEEDDTEYQQEEDLEEDDTEHQQEEDGDNPFNLDEDGIFNPLELSILGEVLDLINDENEFPEIEEILKLEFDKSTPYYMILEVLDTVFEKFNDESEDDDSELINIGDEEYVYLVPVDFDCIDLERLKDGPFFVNIATPSYFKYVSDDSGMSFEEVLECYLHGLVVDERGFYEPNDNRFKSKITQKDINRHGFKENDYVIFKQEDFEQL